MEPFRDKCLDFTPRLHDDFLARAQLQLMTLFLHIGHSEDMPARLARVPRA